MPATLPSAHRSSPLIPRHARPVAGRVFIALLLFMLLFVSPAPAAAQTPPGAGSALHFDGVDDYVEIPYDEDLSFGSGDFTVELWVQRLNAGARADLFALNNEAGKALTIYIQTDNRVRFDTWDGPVDSSLTSTATVGTGWTHIAFVRKGKVMSIYINGRLSGSSSSTLRNFESNSSIRIGKLFREDNFWLRGAMDELRIWRTARTQPEILQNMYRALAVPQTNLIAYYTFDQSGTDASLTDSSGNGHHGELMTKFTFAPSPWRLSGAFQGPGNALSFDGSNDFVSIQSSPSLQPGEYTIEGWINRNAFSSKERTIICKGSSGPYLISFDPATGKVSFSLDNSTTRQTITSQTNILASRWYHLAITYSAADGGTMKLYVNGLLEGHLTGAGEPVKNTSPLMIGGSSSTGADNFWGLIDEVRIWSRARTAAEIRETMAHALSGSEADLSAYYRFDQVFLTDDLDPFARSVYDWGPARLDGNLSPGYTLVDTNWPVSSAFNTWIGGVSSDWTGATNWSRNAVPASTDTVGVPAGSAFSPTISANASLRTLVIGSSAALTAAGSPTLTIGGHWFNQGTFTPDNSTVVLSGSNQSLAGSTTFNNLTKTITSADTLSFSAGETQTVTGTLTLKGTAETKRLALRSSQPGVQWKIDPRGARDLDYLDVQDSHNINAATIIVGESDILDSGNNTGWAFGSPPVITEGESVSVDMSEDGAPIPFSLTLNATDPDGDALTWSLATPPLHGTAEAAGTGECLEVDYIPNNGYSGEDSFVVEVSDDKDGSDSITVNVTIQAVNAPPIFNGSSQLTLDEDDSHSLDLAPLFSDTDGDPITFTLETEPVNGSASIVDEILTYTPDPNYNGEDSLTITASDGQGGTLDVTFNYTIKAVNDAPTSANKTVTTDEDTPYAFAPADFPFADVDAGDMLDSVQITTLPEFGSLTLNGTTVSAGDSIAVADLDAGRVVFQPAANANGSGYASFTFRVSDGYDFSGDHTLTIDVTPVNDPPVFSGSTSITLQEDGYKDVDLAAHFSDVDGDSLTYEITTGPTNGSAAIDGATLTYTPDSDYHGSDSLTITAADNNGGSLPVDLTFTVTAFNDAPALLLGEYALPGIAEDVIDADNPGLTISSLLSDSVRDVDGEAVGLAVTEADNTHGAWQYFDGSAWQAVDEAGTPAPASALLLPPAAKLRFVPAANFHGAATLSVRAWDQTAGTAYGRADVTTNGGSTAFSSAQGSVSVVVSPVNDAPAFSGDNPTAVTLDEDSSFTSVDLLPLFSDADGDPLSFEITTAPANGIAELSTAVIADGLVLVYTPKADFYGGDSLTVTVTDGQGGSLPVAFNFTVTPVNDPPLINGTPMTTVAAGSPYTFIPTASDVDSDSLTFSIANQPAWASFDPATGALTGTPDNADAGTTSGIVISVSDGQGGAASLPAFDLTVTFTNHPPAAAGIIPAQRAAVGEAFAYTVPRSFFTDSDAQDLLFTAALAGGSDLPAWLTFDPSVPSFSGTPGLTDAGTLFITVTVTDPYGAQAALTFSLTVESPDNRSPLQSQPIPDRFVAVGIPFTFTVPAGTFFDPDGDSLAYYAQLANGQRLPDWLALDGGTNTFHGTPPETGTWTLLLTAGDGLGGAVSAVFNLTVSGDNLPPYLQMLIPDQAASAGSAFTFTLDPRTFVDPNGDPFTLQAELSDGSPLPNWLHFDPETLTFSGVPPAGQSEVLLVRVFSVQQRLKFAPAALPMDADPASDLFLIAISAADVAYLPVDITGAQTALNQAQVTLSDGQLPVHPHYILKIETGIAGPPAPAGWVSLERNLRVSVVDATGSPVAGSGSASICFALTPADWALGNGEARNFAAASAPSATGSWRWLETAADAEQRTACAEVPFGLAGLFVPVQPEPDPAAQLPATGFAPERVTPLPAQAPEQVYTELGSLWLEIPRLGVQAEIVGVPYTENGAWDVTWLGRRAGWLESTAFPTWAGNSLLAAHAVDAGGRAGPFARLGELRYGDRIIVHLFGQRYIYEVRTVDALTAPDDTRALRHEERPWLTLVTCRGYDEGSGDYRWRTVVRAVLVRIEE